MEHLFKKFTAALVTLAMILSVVTMTGAHSVSAKTKKAVKSVTVTNVKDKKLTLEVEQTFALKTKVVVTGNASKKVTFKSSDSKVAKVDSKGVITAMKAGKATITVASKVKKSKKTKIKVTVKKAAKKTSTTTEESESQEADDGSDDQQQTEEQKEQVTAPVEENATDDDSASQQQTTSENLPAADFKDDDSKVAVAVKAPEGALPEGASMKVTDVDVKDVKEAVKDVVDADDMQAIDISFKDTDGNEIEPKKDVTVELTADIISKPNLKVVHIDDNGKATIVENVKIDANKATLTFKQDEFSTFVLTWSEEGIEKTATVHWGTYKDGEFEELESPTSIDTTTSSVKLDVIIDEDYYFVGAEYKESADAEARNLASNTLKKVDGVWKITLEGESGNETVALAEGSDIYVNYAEKGSGGYTPPSQAPEEVLAPETNKTVTDNGDGTYTIQLDVEGKEDENVTQVGANVIVIMDITQSMTNSMPGGGTRMAAAKQALTTLINTLDPDTNLINFTAVNFGNSATYSNGVAWTTSKATMQSYVSSLPNNPNDLGTCWQAGLQGGIDRVGTAPAGNETYVLFVTDGNPNGWVNANGRYQQQGSGQFIQAAYNAAVPNANQLAQISHFYGIFCGDADGYTHLEDLVTNAHGDGVINGNTTSAIESAFASIANTIVENLGSGSVVVDDGIPSLSNVSANVTAGEAGGFEYYITPKGGSQQEWEEAPGASYSNTNGVTWNLSEAGTLKDGWVYTLKFTVWPSQEAYDLIADLNNGLREFDELTPDEKQGVEGSKETGYTLKTNTHLYTTFKDLEGNEYSEVNDASAKAMPLPTKTISVKKIWPENALDSYGAATYRDEDGNEQTATEITLNLQKDKADYLDVTVKGSEGWKKDDIYVSCGNMVVKDGQVTIHETGHDYQIVEPAAFSYYWDLISDVYHPMVINGSPVLLVLNEKLSTADNENSFEINGKIYEKHSDTENTLEASNYRRSNLNLTKAVEAEGAQDTYFTYNVTVTDASSTDGNVWFSAWDPEANAVVKDSSWVISGATAQEGNTGYWYATNGAAVKLKIKAGWNVRFLNLYHGSTFDFEEVDIPDYYSFEKVEAEASEDFMDDDNADWYEADGQSISGTITEPNNSYTVTYTNKFEAFYVYHSGVAGDGNLEVVEMPENNGTYDLTQNVTENTLYGGYYLDYAGKGDYKDDGIKGTTGVAYTGMNYDWSEAQTVKGTEITPVAGETYYIKEVPTYYLRNYHQINFVKATSELKALYLISAIDDLNYDSVGFTLKNSDDQEADVSSTININSLATGKTITLKPSTVFKSLGITGEGTKIDDETTAEDSEDDYLTYWDATSSDYFAVGDFTVLPYWVTPDGIKVSGISTRTITISEMKKSGVTKSDS